MSTTKPTGRAGTSAAKSRSRSRKRRPSPGRLAGRAIGLTVLVWLVVVGITAFRTNNSLEFAEDALVEAKASLQAGDLTAARAQLVEANDIILASHNALFRPDMALAAQLPLFGRDLRIGRGIVDAADEVVVQAIALIDKASALTEGDLAADGLPVEQIAEIAPDVRQLADTARLAVAKILQTPQRAFTQDTANDRTRVLEILEPIAGQLDDLAGVAEALPDFLGNNGPRNYLVAAANPAELRGIGGYLGSYTVLTIEDGQLDFGQFEPLNERENLEPGDIPTDVLAPRYEPFGSTWLWKNVNLTPDMPSAGRALTLMWAKQTGQDLDGVIVVDPFALQTMLQITGPVTADDTELTAENVVAYLTNEAYADYDDTNLRKEELGDAAKLVLQEFLGRGADLIDSIGDLTRLVSERQLLVFSTDPVTQGAFAQAGIDGALPDPDGEMLADVVNSATNAKVDYYLTRAITYDVDLLEGGGSTGRLEISLRNGAPTSGTAKYVLGPNVPDLVAAENRFYLSTYCATHCTITSGRGGLSGRSTISTELHHPVVGTWMQLKSGQTEAVTYDLENGRSWTWEGEELVYRLHVRVQTAINNPRYTVNVTVPEGFVFNDGSYGIEIVDGIATRVATPRGDLVLEYRFIPEDLCEKLTTERDRCDNTPPDPNALRNITR